MKWSFVVWHIASKTLNGKCRSTSWVACRCIHLCRANRFLFRKKDTESRLTLREDLFKNEKGRDRKAFVDVVERFKLGNINRKGHVEFINVATKYLQDFNVHKDVSIYKMLFDLFPKGRYTPRNLIQAEFMHYPYHQECAVSLLDTMEEHGICPDREFRQMVLHTFGYNSEVFKKHARMMYWMPKFKHMSPYPLPNPIPKDAFLLARLAVERMAVDLQTKVTTYDASQLEDALHKTWVVSGQSPEQRQLISKHPGDKPLRIEGPFTIYLREAPISYFVLRAPPQPSEILEVNADDVSNIKLAMFGEAREMETPSTVHEQDDGIILGLCVTGTSSRDSLLSWLRFLQEENPRLKEIPVVFTLRAPSEQLVPLSSPN
ncbi:evolutionarily conserved signaling intermediate in Toll pathway, mitochondrial-like [Ornithodoros turicata]|uniref:evolutionarily conserved signaling intermediate in Toll pathway, mitochondrial-like n=1 Tax=Ornithodoros turicata TaxID=34597 RepID=UPI003139A81B